MPQSTRLLYDRAMTITPLLAEETRPLRSLVLRPGKPLTEVVYPGDDAAGTLHLGVRGDNGNVLAVASFFREPWADLPETPGYRLRGMAVQPDLRGTGIGRALLLEGLERLCLDPAVELVWCNARVTAIGFYERLGFAVLGEPFLVPGTDIPHRIGVWRR